MRTAALALLALLVTSGLGYGAATLMKASSPENDACIGCGLVLLMSIGLGIALAVAIIVYGVVRRDQQS